MFGINNIGIPKYEDGKVITIYAPRELYDVLSSKMKNLQKKTNSGNIAIPYIAEKNIKLTNAGKLTGAEFSTNMLDSIAKYAARAKLPIKQAIGLAAQESSLGNANTEGYIPQKERGVIYGSSLISNWSHSRDNPYRDLIVTSEIQAGLRDSNTRNGELELTREEKRKVSLIQKKDYLILRKKYRILILILMYQSMVLDYLSRESIMLKIKTILRML